MSKQLICAGLLFAITAPAYAQHASGVMAVPSTPMPMARPATVAPMPMAHTAPATTAHPPATARSHASPTVNGRPAPRSTSRPSTGSRPNKYPRRPVNSNFVAGSDFADETPVPGLGFDYAHFFAVHPNWQRDHPSTGAIFPFVGGGLYIPVPYYEAAAAGNEIADSNDSTATEPSNPEGAENEVEPASTRVRSRSNSAPAPANTTEYVFVRRDGTVFFAVAYSWADGKLQYITQDGLRKFASLDTLDLKATQQFNEQSGQTLTTPSL